MLVYFINYFLACFLFAITAFCCFVMFHCGCTTNCIKQLNNLQTAILKHSSNVYSYEISNDMVFYVLSKYMNTSLYGDFYPPCVPVFEPRGFVSMISQSCPELDFLMSRT